MPTFSGSASSLAGFARTSRIRAIQASPSTSAADLPVSSPRRGRWIDLDSSRQRGEPCHRHPGPQDPAAKPKSPPCWIAGPDGGTVIQRRINRLGSARGGDDPVAPNRRADRASRTIDPHRNSHSPQEDRVRLAGWQRPRHRSPPSTPPDRGHNGGHDRDRRGSRASRAFRGRSRPSWRRGRRRGARRRPRSQPTESGDGLEAFIGFGSSGRSEPFDIARARSDLAAAQASPTAPRTRQWRCRRMTWRSS